MAKWVIFEDATNDEHAYPIENINALFITSATNITVYVRRSVRSGTDGVVDDTIALTVITGGVADTLEMLLSEFSQVKQHVVRVSTGAYNDITTVAYTAGA